MRCSAVSAVLSSAFAVMVCACSLSTSDVDACERTEQCRAGFGLGSVCQSDGFCSAAEQEPRCSKSYPADLFEDYAQQYEDLVIVGNLMDRSLETHQARENAAQLAFQQINESGGVGGIEFGVVFCTVEENPDFDDLDRASAAVASARYLIDVIGVPAIIGPAASGDVQAVFTEIAGDDVLLISPSATSPALSELETPPFSDQDPGMLWRTAPPDSLQGQAIADDMSKPGPGRTDPVSSVAVIREIGAYGDGLAHVFDQAFKGTVIDFSYDSEAVLGETIAFAGAAEVEEVLFISSQTKDAIDFFAAATLPAYDDKSIFMTDAAANSDVLMQAAPDRFPQVRGSRPAPLDPVDDIVYTTFLSSYFTIFDEDAEQFSFVAHAYDAAWLVGYGTAWALLKEDGISGRNIARGIRRLSDPTGPEIEIRASTWADLLAHFESGQSVNITGASGPLDYDPDTEETTSDIQIWTIQNRQITGIDIWTP